MKNLPIFVLFLLLIFITPLFSKVNAITCDLNSHEPAPCKDINGNIIGYEEVECKGPSGQTYAVVTKSCGGGGGGGSNSSQVNINGVVLASDTGEQRWIRDNTCGHNFYGIDLQRSDRSNSNSDINWPCDPFGGHFDIIGVEKDKDVSFTLDLPVNKGYICSQVTWNLTDRNDLNNTSDDVIVKTGTGCTADVKLSSASWDWRYGVIFFMSNQVPLVSPTPTYVCSPDAKTATINWNVEPQASFYAVRLDGSHNGWGTDVNAVCSAGVNGLNGDYCFDTNNNLITSAVFTVTPNVENRFWIHSNRYLVGNSGAFEWGVANHIDFRCNVANIAPVCQTPVITPAGNITNSFSATGTATDDNGIKQTGIYIYKKSPNTYVRELQSNGTSNTSTSVTKGWDLKDDTGSIVADGNYEIHYNWYDEQGLMSQCKADFAKVAITPSATYACTTGVTPSSFTFVPSQSQVLSIVVNSSVNSTANVLWSDSCGLGTFDISANSSLTKSYSLINGTNTLTVNWKAKSTNPVIVPGCNVQATIQNLSPQPTSNVMPSCSVSNVTASSTNTATWSGKAIWNNLDCPVDANSSIWTSSQALPNVTVSVAGLTDVTDSTGDYSITQSFFGSTTTQRINASAQSGDYSFVCYKNANTVKISGTTNWNNDTYTPGNYSIIPYFKYAPAPFIVANNGEVYSGFNIQLNKPSVVNTEFFQDSTSDTLGGLVMAKGTVTSEWGNKTTEGYDEQGIEGYNLDLSVYLDKLIVELDKIKTTTDIIFKVPNQNVIYVEGDFDITADDLISDYAEQVIIVSGNVNITDSDNFGSNKIQSYILASGDINFESTNDKPENILKFLGSIFTKESISFNRSKSILNDKFKEPTIQFDLDAGIFVKDNLDTVKVSDIRWRELL